MNSGKRFEQNFKNSIDRNTSAIFYLRLNDAAKWLRNSSSSFMPHNIADNLLFKMPFTYLLELKSTSTTSVSFNPNKPYDKPEDGKSEGDIKSHQVKAIMEAVTYNGVIGGLVINFREKKLTTKTNPEETYFIHITDFIKFAEDTGKSGINRDDCRGIGIKIDARLKKVNYIYDVAKFVSESPKVYLNKGYINKEDLIRTREWIDDLLK